MPEYSQTYLPSVFTFSMSFDFNGGILSIRPLTYDISKKKISIKGHYHHHIIFSHITLSPSGSITSDSVLFHCPPQHTLICLIQTLLITVETLQIIR